jgi:glycosyltransferase involved in cell wall biosynthesis
MKYSVIIPAYNAEKTIHRCLDSLLPQLQDDSEIIVVDDGSADHTFDICREFASKESRIHVFTKDNGGVSSARNCGLDHAQGEYVVFVDSDDAVRPVFFDLIRKYTSLDPDYILFHFDLVFSRGKKEDVCTDAKETRKLLCAALRRQLLNCTWSRVFRKELIEQNHLRFDERLSIGEDKVFVVRYSLKCKTACFVYADVYQVFTDNADSLSRKKRASLVDSVILEHELLFEAAEETRDPAVIHAVTFSFFRSAYTAIMELRKFPIPRRERIRRTRAICEKFRREERIRIGSIGDWLFAAPVKLKMANLIDLAVRFKCVRLFVSNSLNRL